METLAAFRLRSPSPEATHAVARALSSVLEEGGLVIALRGPLGAGKTGFVKGLAEGLGLDPGVVSSPTFVIAHEYPAAERGVRLVHLDLYRLEHLAELESAGFLDVLDAYSIVAIEWADRIPEALPADRLEIELSGPCAEAQGERTISVSAHGLLSASVLRRWSLCLGIAGTVELENVACP
ncbi:MAG: tRNA (adenosine(37)-N6)-threonylcarbamoyltransferase complex ATPase subunit type 1 TsaE [Deltaproteobacteria bacterium]|nr:tRNA (adenosine(37)-N6)-threonylcarbamoyltransferase complex ATPase subunit type 1 TsaE [Deltaproteobacteria bacterium]